MEEFETQSATFLRDDVDTHMDWQLNLHAKQRYDKCGSQLIRLLFCQVASMTGWTSCNLLRATR